MGTGRTPDEGVARDFSLCIRLTPAQKKALDDARGSTSRSSYVRNILKQHTGGAS